MKRYIIYCIIFILMQSPIFGAEFEDESLSFDQSTLHKQNTEIFYKLDAVQKRLYNLENEATTLYQIWIEPNKKGVPPQWDQANFPKQPSDTLQLLVAGDPSAPLHIHQDAYIFGGVLKKETTLTQTLKHQGYILISRGQVQVDGITANAGDANRPAARMVVSLFIVFLPIVRGFSAAFR